MIESFLKLMETDKTETQICELQSVLHLPLQEILQKKQNIYFVSGVRRGSTARAKDVDIVEKNYIAFDFDLANEYGWCPEQIKTELRASLEYLLDFSELKPLALVFSGGGGHYYFRTPLVTDFTNWRLVYKFLQKKLEKELVWRADSACQNPSRIMRLPGTWNIKRDIQTEILYTNKNAPNVFSLKEYFAFKKQVFLQKSVVESVTVDTWNEKNIKNFSNKKMLQTLSGKPIVRGEVYSFRKRSGGGEYIDVNGEPADAWLDVYGRIGSGKGGGPTWVDWIKYYGVSEKKINKFLFEEKLVTMDEPSFLEYEIDKKVKVFTWGTPRLDQLLSPIRSEQSNLLTGATSAGKTTFAFDVAWKNAEMGHRVLYLSLEMSKNEIETRLARSYAGITKEEWRDTSTISSFKRMKFKDRINQLRLLKTLVLSGMSCVTPTTENIFKSILLVSPDIVFIDNFDLIQKRYGRNQYEEENRISAELKDFPKRENIPIIILHHRSKKGVENVNGVRGSGKITHDRYTALRCEREYSEESTDEENARFYIVEEKDRDFGHGKRVLVYFRFGSFYDNFNI